MLKDPIRIHPRQLAEMERLLSERRAPPNAQFNACQVDTAATVLPDGRISVARPLQQTNRVHYKVFCECEGMYLRHCFLFRLSVGLQQPIIAPLSVLSSISTTVLSFGILSLTFPPFCSITSLWLFVPIPTFTLVSRLDF